MSLYGLPRMLPYLSPGFVSEHWQVKAELLRVVRAGIVQMHERQSDGATTHTLVSLVEHDLTPLLADTRSTVVMRAVDTLAVCQYVLQGQFDVWDHLCHQPSLDMDTEAALQHKLSSLEQSEQAFEAAREQAKNGSLWGLRVSASGIGHSSNLRARVGSDATSASGGSGSRSEPRSRGSNRAEIARARTWGGAGAGAGAGAQQQQQQQQQALTDYGDEYDEGHDHAETEPGESMGNNSPSGLPARSKSVGLSGAGGGKVSGPHSGNFTISHIPREDLTISTESMVASSPPVRPSPIRFRPVNVQDKAGVDILEGVGQTPPRSRARPRRRPTDDEGDEDGSYNDGVGDEDAVTNGSNGTGSLNGSPILSPVHKSNIAGHSNFTFGEQPYSTSPGSDGGGIGGSGGAMNEASSFDGVNGGVSVRGSGGGGGGMGYADPPPRGIANSPIRPPSSTVRRTSAAHDSASLGVGGGETDPYHDPSLWLPRAGGPAEGDGGGGGGGAGTAVGSRGSRRPRSMVPPRTLTTSPHDVSADGGGYAPTAPPRPRRSPTPSELEGLTVDTSQEVQLLSHMQHPDASSIPASPGRDGGGKGTGAGAGGGGGGGGGGAGDGDMTPREGRDPAAQNMDGPLSPNRASIIQTPNRSKLARLVDRSWGGRRRRAEWGWARAGFSWVCIHEQRPRPPPPTRSRPASPASPPPPPPPPPLPLSPG